MSNPRAIWMAIIILAAALIGIAGGTLALIGGTTAPGAMLTGAGGFGAAVALLLAIAYFLDGNRP
ncbi:hypothetical protein DP939_43000 [Spongiactinospora rosea]|uniref:Uncharacterized protein n=1 Tax=Spongiactinospora rosea TaxID=2248750 RepID=A0A366LJ87_9ACTN|nr:hypothetical protein [Spongiactinospora rosea]RBQ13955.1 hypothetical protein DP939_43000 [Spongiactinospora rosea]